MLQPTRQRGLDVAKVHFAYYAGGSLVTCAPNGRGGRRVCRGGEFKLQKLGLQLLAAVYAKIRDHQMLQLLQMLHSVPVVPTVAKIRGPTRLAATATIGIVFQ